MSKFVTAATWGDFVPRLSSFDLAFILWVELFHYTVTRMELVESEWGGAKWGRNQTLSKCCCNLKNLIFSPFSPLLAQNSQNKTFLKKKKKSFRPMVTLWNKTLCGTFLAPFSLLLVQKLQSFKSLKSILNLLATLTSCKKSEKSHELIFGNT